MSLREEVNEAIDGTDGQAHVIAVGVRPLALAVVGAVEILSSGDIIDTDGLGSALERGLDGLGQELRDAIERGFSEMARSIEKIEVTR